MTFIAIEENFNAQFGSTSGRKNIQRCIIWGYYSIRNYIHYGIFNIHFNNYLLVIDPCELLLHSIILILLQHETSKIFDSYIKSIKFQNEMVIKIIHKKDYSDIFL